MHELLEQAALKVGGKSELARRIGVQRQAMHQWDRIPAERVLAVEAATGISRTKWRPDIYPPRRVNKR